MKYLFLSPMIVLFASKALAEETNRHQFSNAPNTSRFEIIQSGLAAKITLKIDKYTGRVYQLVQGTKGLSWSLLASEKHPDDKVLENKVNYQVFISGLAVRMTYLINVNTGASWQLAADEEIGNFWKALE